MAWILVGSASIVLYRNLTIDDAFITWRHGLNLVQVGRYQANPTGQAVESATSVLYGLLSTVPALLGVDVVFFFKLVSVAIVGLLVIAAVRLFHVATDRTLFVLLMIGGPVQAIHLWSGLETPTFVALLTLVFLRVLGSIRLGDRLFGVILGLLVLTRPEGILVLVGVLLVQALGETDSRMSRARDFIRNRFWIWIPPLGVASTVLVGRLILFGEMLPNGASTKIASTGDLGARLTQLYVNASAWVWVIAGMSVTALALGQSSLRTKFLLLGAMGTSPVLVGYAVSDLQMNFAERFPYQIAWPLLVAGVVASREESRSKFLLGSLVTFLMTLSMSPGNHAYLIDYYPRATAAHAAIGKALAGTEPGLLVFGDAGMGPMASGWTLLDPFFLVTPAGTGLTGIEDVVRQDQSRLVVVLQSDTPTPDGLWERLRPIGDAAEESGAQFLGGVMWRRDYWLLVWVGSVAAEDKSLVSDLLEVVRDSVRLNDESRIRDAVVGNFWWS